MTKKTLFLLKGIFHQNVDKKYNFLEVRSIEVRPTMPTVDDAKQQPQPRTTNRSTTTTKKERATVSSLSSTEKEGHVPASKASSSTGQSTATTTTTTKFPQDLTPSSTHQSRTNISDLSKLELQRASFTFLDEAKKDHQCIVSMYDLVGKEMPSQTDIHCFWCRHSFETVPIGCPLHYLSHRIIKKMASHTSKDPCFIRENISKQVFQKIQGNVDHVPVIEKDAYVVDGIFCSFPCCLAFIQEQKHRNPTYRNSENLLRQMCQRIFQMSAAPVTIHPAPSWRLLQEYGGHMSISNFRKCFENTHYINNNQLVHKMPTQKIVGFLFEKQITL